MATTNLAAGIPLYIFPDAVDGYKIGIAVSVNSGRTYQMHEFDTGSQGVWPPYNASWFNPGTPLMRLSATPATTVSPTMHSQRQCCWRKSSPEPSERGRGRVERRPALAIRMIAIASAPW
jgi:hypothetical protein